MIPDFAEFEKHATQRMLEVGCGPGTDFMQFVARGTDAIGADLSWKSLQICKQRLLAKNLTASLIRCDAQHLPFMERSFDFAYSFGVLHHIPNTEEAIREIHRVLKDGGCFKGMLYNRHSVVAIHIWLRRGILRGHLRRPATILANSQESPGTKAYTFKEIAQLLTVFRNVVIKPTFTAYDATKFFRYRLPSKLIRFMDRFGWFVLVSGAKAMQEADRGKARNGIHNQAWSMKAEISSFLA